MKNKTIANLLLVMMLLSMTLMPMAHAATSTSTYTQILAPVQKIYDFVKYAASLVAMIFLLFSGITYMTSGGDVQKREQAKSMASYVIIGLIVIWAAPFVVQLLTS